MKRILIGAVVALVLAGTQAWAQETKNVNVDLTVGQKPGTKEGVTVIRPGPGGETQILSTETVKGEEKKAERPAVPAVAKRIVPTATIRSWRAKVR